MVSKKLVNPFGSFGGSSSSGNRLNRFRSLGGNKTSHDSFYSKKSTPFSLAREKRSSNLNFFRNLGQQGHRGSPARFTPSPVGDLYSQSNKRKPSRFLPTSTGQFTQRSNLYGANRQESAFLPARNGVFFGRTEITPQSARRTADFEERMRLKSKHKYEEQRYEAKVKSTKMPNITGAGFGLAGAGVSYARAKYSGYKTEQKKQKQIQAVDELRLGLAEQERPEKEYQAKVETEKREISDYERKAKLEKIQVKKANVAEEQKAIEAPQPKSLPTEIKSNKTMEVSEAA